VEKSNRFKSQEIIVATDDHRIASTVSNFGGTFVMTSPNHVSGTDRTWEVMEKRDFDAVINIQGDEPIISEKLISHMVDELDSTRCEVVTPIYFNSSYDEYLLSNVVKVVFNNESKALYFSRSPIPFMNPRAFPGFYQHIGMYGYTKNALRQFVQWPKSILESTEKLEQLRFLENGINIKVFVTPYRSVGVDVPDDVARVENAIKNQPVGK